MAPRPQRIRVDKPAKMLVIEWDDGLIHHFPWTYLRSQCPSATEKAAREAAAKNPLQVLGQIPSSELTQIRPVGNYALSFTWSDGHSFGIYTWEYLRELSGNPVVVTEPQK